ncbi:MAG: pyruvate, phosphate dikinase [Promethearchaeota archaeon]
MTKKMVWMFDEPREGTLEEQKLKFGGKGSGLAMMTQMGLPVPPGFTIPCEISTKVAEGSWPEGLKEQVIEAIKKLEEKSGRKFGDPQNPLLVSVRSGAPISMPGMMDTVLNLGMNKKVAEKMAESNPRFAWDSWRRFIMSYSDIVKGTGREPYDEILEKYKANKGVKSDIDLDADDMKEISELYLKEYKELNNEQFPEDPYEQLFNAIDAVFHSWDSPKAKVYRRLNKIPEYGTAVNVQMMVFGNLNNNSGTGVLFTRSPMTGEKKLVGEFLFNAQGEDVVAGVRTPVSIEELKKTHPKIYEQIEELANKLEQAYKDMQDCEITVQDGKLYFLQTRNGKRTANAAIKIAIEQLHEGLIDEETAILRVGPSRINELLYRRIDPEETKKPIAKGYSASPGTVSGKAVFDVNRAIEKRRSGEKVILVRKETKPEDFPGMVASVGILTSRGGKTCHAAVVARGIGLPAVVGAGELLIEEERGKAYLNDKLVFQEDDIISIDGTTGLIYKGAVKTIEPKISGEFAEYLKLCDKYRKLGVRTNADTPEMAKNALNNGAEGIGLCRTERMFNAEDRLPKVVRMILANNEKERLKALEALKPLQKQDFKEIFHVMNGKPVTVRLLDPPLHEFLPDYKSMIVELTELRVKGINNARRKELEKLIKKYEELKEDNAMLGHRGVRLGNTNPEIYKMQVSALMEALIEAEKEGIEVKLEIMFPLISHVNELKRLLSILKPHAEKELIGHKPKHPIMWGTMIEVPRSAITADEIAEYAEFFSFGTNDLTQMTFGFSRDDVEGKFLDKYIEGMDPPILKENPFEHLDEKGVGELIKIAVNKGRKVRMDKHGQHLEVGICGETGGDPKSILFLHKVGLDYVSCSPFRVPTARVAAAHAAVLEKQGKL